MYLYHAFLFLITPVLAVKPFLGGMLKDTKKQLARNELVALNFVVLGISLFKVLIFDIFYKSTKKPRVLLFIL